MTSDIYDLFRKPRVDPVAPESVATSATPYAAAALRGEAEKVAAAPEGSRNDQLNKSAYATSQLIAGGELPATEAWDALTAAARHAGLADREIESTLRSGYQAGAANPRSTPNGSPVPGTRPEPGTTTVPGSRPPVWEPGTAGTVQLYADVAGLLDGTIPDPPEPDVLTRSDGRAIFYAGQVNWIFGDPESGKTFVALAAVAEHLRDGGRGIVLDLDHNGIHATIQRLVMLGAPTDALRDLSRFRYVEPEDYEHLLAVVKDCRTWKPGVAVVDSIGELLPLFGASSNSPDDFTGVHSKVMKPLAMAGASVLCIDHLAKNSESRAIGATGTAAKGRAIGGVSLRVKIADQFTPGRGGSCHLTINKDRHGGLRKHSPSEDKEPIAGTFVLTADPLTGDTTWRVTAPAMTDRNPDEVAPPEDVAAIAALDPLPTSGEDARERLGWRKQRALAALREYRKAPPATTVPGSHIGGREPGTALHKCGDCGDPLDGPSLMKRCADKHQTEIRRSA
ncbi:hypothetical protein V2J52_13290 [Georgenia sp. MJ173]|uniref:hypothetical protein n=1 Tax=Georgenia sunbinii TaxID=3117728 RepID=UPI002F262189